MPAVFTGTQLVRVVVEKEIPRFFLFVGFGVRFGTGTSP